MKTFHTQTGAFLIGMLLILCLPQAGGSEPWEDFQRSAAHLTSIEAEFTQHKHLRILARPFLSSGRFFFQKPDSIRWEYLDPVKSVLLMHRGKIRRYTLGSRGMVEDASQALSSMQVVVQEIGLWSQGRFAESAYFKVEIAAGPEVKIILTPKEEAFTAFIGRIEITPSAARKGVIDTVTIVESEGNETVIRFKNVKINERIAESVFRDVE